MINWKIINTKRADSDLCDIANYIKYNLQSPDTARKIVDAIVDNIESLNDMPDRFPLYGSEPWHHRGLRKIIVGRYIIFYIAVRGTSEVIVITIMHGSRNVDKILQSLDKKLLEYGDNN